MKAFFLKILLVPAFISVTSLHAAAEYTVRGKITDSDGEPLAGASIVVRGLSGTGAMADAEGNYVLKVPDDRQHTIVVSFMGFMTQSRILKPEDASHVDFSLEENTVNLDQVVVTGTRTPKTLKDAPITTRVITSLDIERSDASDIQDLLVAELPGIEFSFSMDQQINVNLQGFGGSSVLFLIDGERIAGETLDNVDYNRLNLDNVERIEIVKGGASSLYGSNAVGGVINLITKESDEPWSVNLNARYGAHNEQKYDGSAGFSSAKGKVSNLLNAQYRSIDTYDVGGIGDFNTVYGKRSLSVKDRLVYSPLENLKFTARVGWYQRERDADVIVKDRYRDINGGLKGNWKINGNGDLEISYAYDEYNKSDFMSNTGSDVLNYSNVQHNVRAMLNWTFGKAGTLTAGGDFMNDYLLSYQFADGGSRSQITADCFAQFDWNVVKGFKKENQQRFPETRSHVSYRQPQSRAFRIPRLVCQGIPCPDPERDVYVVRHGQHLHDIRESGPAVGGKP